MVGTAPWRDVPATAMAMGPAPCQTTSRAGSVSVRADGMGRGVTSDWSSAAMTRLTMTKVRTFKQQERAFKESSKPLKNL